MTFLYVILFALMFAPVYTYVLYPLLLMLFKERAYKQDLSYRPAVTVIIAAYNEEKVIAGKIENLARLRYPGGRLDFIIASDGSTDNTVAVAKRYAHMQNLRILDLPRGGKVNALNRMLSKAAGDVVVFSDANTMFDENAILELVKHFADDRIGCVSGQMRYSLDQRSGYGARSESAYWKYENWVKEQESRIGRLSGANGAIYAIRKSILPEIRKGIINDDFYVATYILQAGYDVILEQKAIAYEEPNDAFVNQFKRHIRDGAGHYQAIAVFWRMLFPRKGSFTHISHRIVKWVVPFALIGIFLISCVLSGRSALVAVLFIAQIAVYLMALLYYMLVVRCNKGSRGMAVKLWSMVFYFLSVNAALALGFIRLIRGKQKAIWETQR